MTHIETIRVIAESLLEDYDKRIPREQFLAHVTQALNDVRTEIPSMGGKASSANMTKEQRIKRARDAANARPKKSAPGN